jgi:16S rRNA (cytidine1402-2'-O)-methyltransferase
VARELTKRHETIRTGPIAAVRQQMEGDSRKGEFVVLIARAGFALA